MYALGLIIILAIILIPFAVWKRSLLERLRIFDYLGFLIVAALIVAILILSIQLIVEPAQVLGFLNLPTTALFKGMATGLGLVMIILEFIFCLWMNSTED